MATQTNRNLQLDVVQVTTAGESITLSENLSAVVLQARGGNIQLKLGAVDDTEYFTLKQEIPVSFAERALAGATLYFDAASTLNVEVLQFLNEVQ